MTYEVDYQSGCAHFKGDRSGACQHAQWLTVTGRSSWAQAYAVDSHGRRTLVVAYDESGRVEATATPIAVPGARSRLSQLAERAGMCA